MVNLLENAENIQKTPNHAEYDITIITSRTITPIFTRQPLQIPEVVL